MFIFYRISRLRGSFLWLWSLNFCLLTLSAKDYEGCLLLDWSCRFDIKSYSFECFSEFRLEARLAVVMVFWRLLIISWKLAVCVEVPTLSLVKPSKPLVLIDTHLFKSSCCTLLLRSSINFRWFRPVAAWYLWFSFSRLLYQLSVVFPSFFGYFLIG